MGRVILYSHQGASLVEVLSLQKKALSAGIHATACAVGLEWDTVLDSLEQGDEFVVESLDCFVSLNELLGVVAGEGVQVRSLSEPWFSAPIADPQQYQRQLYELSSQLHANRTRQGLDRARLEGRTPGRREKSRGQKSIDKRSEVRQVDLLRQEFCLSVADACRRVGISMSVYYRNK